MAEDLKEIRYIRMRYSIILSYLLVFYRVLTAFIFTTIVLRRLDLNEYGLFTVVLALISIFQTVTALWRFWIFRYYTRKLYSRAYAGFIVNTAYSIFSSTALLFILLYMNLSPLVTILSSLSLLLIIFYSYFTALISSIRPYMVSYIGIFGETVRVISAYIFLKVMDYGLTGVFLAFFLFIVSQLISSLLVIKWLKIEIPLSRNISFKNIVSLFKNFYITLTGLIGYQLRVSAERIVVLVLSGDYSLPAYLGVSYLSRNFVIGSSYQFTRVLSSRLLRGFSRNDVEDALRIGFIINIFMAGSMIIFSKPVLSILNPMYLNVYPLLALYSVVFLLDVTRTIFSEIGISSEKADMYSEGLELRRTLLFRNPLLFLVSSILQLAVASTIFELERNAGLKDPVSLLLPFPLTSITMYSITMYILYKRSLKLASYRIPYRELTASLIGVFLVYVVAWMNNWVNLTVKSIYTDYPQILLIAITSIIVYVSTLLIISPWFRRFLRIALRSMV